MNARVDTGQVYAYFSSIQEKPVEWLWYPYIPYGKITILQGDPGDGKSTFILNIAARLTCGKPMPDGYPTKAPQTVVYQCVEDGLADTVKPRLIAAGADCDRVAYIINEEGDLNIQDDRIEQTIRDTSARLFVLDPLQSFLTQDGDMQSAVRVRTLLGKLAAIAARNDCAVVLICHMNKSSGFRKSLYRSLGSIDIAAIARSILMIERDEENPAVRWMFPVKSSLASDGPGIGFWIRNDRTVQWLRPKDEVLAGKASDWQFEESKQDVCENLLMALLCQGEIASNDIMHELESLGLSERTLRNVKKRLGIKSVRRKGVWYWKMGCEENTEGDQHETGV